MEEEKEKKKETKITILWANERQQFHFYVDSKSNRLRFGRLVDVCLADDNTYASVFYR